jgi:transcriptional regulator with XRE-family HTH domain
MDTTLRPFGELLREWRERRRYTQLGLATEADISARHLSFLETGRSRPSREMVLHLAEQLQVPLNNRNAVLEAAGFAPVFSDHSLDDTAMHMASEAVGLVLTGHEPYPALAVDRYWNLLDANRAIGPFLKGIPAALLEPPVNVFRLTLHPGGLAPRIANYAEWRDHLLARVRRQADTTGDPAFVDLLEELRSFAPPEAGNTDTVKTTASSDDIARPLRLRSERGLLSFIYTTTVFGTATDVTLSGLAIESFFPADADTAATLRWLADEVHAGQAGGATGG